MLKEIFERNRSKLRPLWHRLATLSITLASKEQDLETLSNKLSHIVPDIRDQYTTFEVKNEYLIKKVRTQHAFQISLVLKAIPHNIRKPEMGIVDIGDSAGTHLTYLIKLLKDDKRYNETKFSIMSINCDPIAVKKIISKGIPAKLCSAEDYICKNHNCADILLSFEMLEHLNDPISFLNAISEKKISDRFVVTVPFLSESRVGLHHIRKGQKRVPPVETTHVFELSPKDWRLIFNHSGWEILHDNIYFQYPKKSLLRIMKPLWKKFDYEGFYGAILKRKN